MDTLNVRKARWISKVTLARVVSGYLLPGSPRVLFVETVQGPLFLSTNQNYYCTCLQNFKRRDPFNPNFRKFRGRIKRNSIFRKVRIDNFGQPLEVVLFLFPWSYRFIRCSAPVSSVMIKKTTTSTKTGVKNYTCVF